MYASIRSHTHTYTHAPASYSAYFLTTHAQSFMESTVITILKVLTDVWFTLLFYEQAK